MEEKATFAPLPLFLFWTLLNEDVMPGAAAVILWPWEIKLKDKYQRAEGTRVEDNALDWMFISPKSSDIEILIPDVIELGG